MASMHAANAQRDLFRTLTLRNAAAAGLEAGSYM